MKLFIKNEWYNFCGGKALIVERTDTHVLANVNEQGVKKYRTDCNFHNEVFYPLGKWHDPKTGHAPQCTAQMKWVGISKKKEDNKCMEIAIAIVQKRDILKRLQKENDPAGFVNYFRKANNLEELERRIELALDWEVADTPKMKTFYTECKRLLT